MSSGGGGGILGGGETRALSPKPGLVRQFDARQNLVTLSLKNRDGIKLGQELYVYRLSPKPVFVATVRVVGVTTQKTMAKVVKLYVKGIQVNDRVSAAIKK